MLNRDTESQIFITSVSKDYGDRIKHVEFKKGRYVYREGWNKRREWEQSLELGYVNITYDEHVARLKEQKQKHLAESQLASQNTASWQMQLPFDPITKRFQETFGQERVRSLLKERLARTESLERSIRRSKMTVKELGWANDFDMFITFTFAAPLHYDIQASIDTMKNWLNQQQKQQIYGNKGKFDYLMVMEYHENKEGVHFHALFNNYKGDIKESSHPVTGKVIKRKGHIIYNITSWQHGFSTMTYVKDKNKSVTYMTKYITKDLLQLGMNKKRYWASRGLKKPTKTYNHEVKGDLMKEYELVDWKVSYIKKPDPVTTGGNEHNDGQELDLIDIPF